MDRVARFEMVCVRFVGGLSVEGFGRVMTIGGRDDRKEVVSERRME